MLLVSTTSNKSIRSDLVSQVAKDKRCCLAENTGLLQYAHLFIVSYDPSLHNVLYNFVQKKETQTLACIYYQTHPYLVFLHACNCPKYYYKLAVTLLQRQCPQGKIVSDNYEPVFSCPQKNIYISVSSKKFHIHNICYWRQESSEDLREL